MSILPGFYLPGALMPVGDTATLVETLVASGAKHAWIAGTSVETLRNDAGTDYVSALSDAIADPSARNATQGTTTAQPVWTATGGAFEPTTTWDISTARFEVGTDIAQNVSSLAVLVAYRNTGWASSSNRIFSFNVNASTASRLSYGIFSSGTASVTGRREDTDSTVTLNTTSSILIDTNYISYVEADYVNGTLAHYLNGSSIASQSSISNWTAATDDTTSSSARIGGIGDNAQRLIGEMPAMIIWRNGLPDASQRAAATNKLAEYLGGWGVFG